VPHLLAAPDKFRGTATAAEVAAAAARAAAEAGWTATELPLADGGEGTLDVVSRALGGERRTAKVAGPLGRSVDAAWLFFREGLPVLPEMLARWAARTGDRAAALGSGQRPAAPVAFVESALAIGRSLLPAPTGADPLLARSDGVGELILEAVGAGAEVVLIGAGGSATTDGGAGALRTVGSRERLGGAALIVACDVWCPFGAAEAFAAQKGATPEQVVTLRTRLAHLARRYREELGVDVERLTGAGAAGGLAGGLAALGARLVPGFDVVASLLHVDEAVRGSDLVMTGEGRLDATSFQGKVVGGVLQAGDGAVPALCVAGEVEEGVERCWAARPGRVEAVSLVRAVGRERARHATADAVFSVVHRACRSWTA